MTGRITKVVSKGFGFIESDKEIDFFFHHSEYKGDFKVLLRKYVSEEILIVEFDNDPGAPQGPRALNVKLKDSLKES